MQKSTTAGHAGCRMLLNRCPKEPFLPHTYFFKFGRNVNNTATSEYSSMFEFTVGLQLTIIVIADWFRQWWKTSNVLNCLVLSTTQTQFQTNLQRWATVCRTSLKFKVTVRSSSPRSRKRTLSSTSSWLGHIPANKKKNIIHLDKPPALKCFLARGWCNWQPSRLYRPRWSRWWTHACSGPLSQKSGGIKEIHSKSVLYVWQMTVFPVK